MIFCTKSPRAGFCRVSILLLGCLLVLAACTSPDSGVGEPAASTATRAQVTEPPTVADEYPDIWEAWQNSPHGDTYALEKGPNTYCARCHSPANWDPQATIDDPPNCVSCKFAFEPEPRQAEGNPLVPEDEWESITCENCHRPQEGAVSGEIAWLDTQTGYYQTVGDSSELCGRCHRDTETLRHERRLGSGAHADFTCADCHDPHSAAAGCDQDGCHSPGALAESHDEHHDMVTCVACHDAGGLQVGSVEGQDTWTAFRTVELLGRSNTEPYQYHQLQRDVDCVRCHYEHNPWDLEPLPQDEPDDE